jgi:hypothetical protein
MLVNLRRGSSMVGLVDYYGLETLRREFVQAARLEQSLVCCDGPFLTFDSGSPGKYMVSQTHKSASPDALCLLPCSISTVQSGRR